ncbi:YjbQ family protein [Siminovitchia fortis]|uniref:YjbQ family protein n=1 Tax=Siminovitchia fortis TaxID=254758 RepID=A0A443IVJ0_9BACI|nr:YjbQ family protein [Siminovitchia fortis]RWR12157.1 YjbQ family protein [Siminovitchia fortis]WHY81008.1 YjbQ family protein [Siminovitchia fortis]
MAVYSAHLTLTSSGGQVTYHEITEQVREHIAKSNIQEGICVVASPHTTCSVIFEELSYDTTAAGYEYLQADLNNLLNELVPRCTEEGPYHHPGPNHIKVGLEDFKGKISPHAYTMFNTDAHLKSTLLGTSETFVIENGELRVGLVGYIYFIDWDQTRQRDRTCLIKVIGE